MTDRTSLDLAVRMHRTAAMDGIEELAMGLFTCLFGAWVWHLSPPDSLHNLIIAVLLALALTALAHKYLKRCFSVPRLGYMMLRPIPVPYRLFGLGLSMVAITFTITFMHARQITTPLYPFFVLVPAQLLSIAMNTRLGRLFAYPVVMIVMMVSGVSPVAVFLITGSLFLLNGAVVFRKFLALYPPMPAEDMHPQPINAIQDLQESDRLALLALLGAVRCADYAFLLRETGLPPDSLSTHLHLLRKAGDISLEQQLVGKAPRTIAQLPDVSQNEQEDRGLCLH